LCFFVRKFLEEAYVGSLDAAMEPIAGQYRYAGFSGRDETVFCTTHPFTQPQNAMLYSRHPKMPITVWVSTPHVIQCSLNLLPDSAFQTTPRSVQPFFAQLTAESLYTSQRVLKRD